MGININKSRRIANDLFYDVDSLGGTSEEYYKNLEVSYEGKKYVFAETVPEGIEFITIDGYKYVEEGVINNG